MIMKTKKILAITISCLLLIGAMVGFTASAETEGTAAASATPSVEIYQTNLSYEGAIRILYTLNTANMAADQDVKVVFSFDSAVADPAGVLNAADYDFVGDDIGYINVGGTDYLAVYSDGFAPADMAKTVYAIPVIVDADGAVVASGKTVAFSVRDYLMARLNGNCTKEQFLLYMAALDFGGSVQNAQKVTEDKDPAYGYVDAYYVLKVMDGSGEVTTYSYREPTEISLKAPKGYDGKLFDSFVDNKGVKYEDADFNIYNFKLDKIGTTYVKYVYGDTEISMDGLTAAAGNSATLANPDTDVIVKGGAEYYLEADVTLASGTVAALDFMANETTKIGTINLSEADGVVTVSDGITSFEMANGSALRVEYVVISQTANTGTLFYYVNGEYVAKTDVAAVEGTSNAGFASVVASATAGEIVLEYATVGAKDGVITFPTIAAVSVVYDYDPAYGKYFWYNKPAQNTNGGVIQFEINEAVQSGATTALEAKVKLAEGFISAGAWRNFMDLQFQTDFIGGRRYNIMNPAATRVAFTPTAFYWKGSATNGTAYTITNAIAEGEWFDLKIEHVGNKSYTIYINGEAVYTAKNGTAAMDILTITPAYDGSGSIYMADVKYTSK